jgi:hypothetical protein
MPKSVWQLPTSLKRAETACCAPSSFRRRGEEVRHVRPLLKSLNVLLENEVGIGHPLVLATCPQIALPSVMEPKNTVMYIARPRPRTQSGKATCADTLRVGTAAILVRSLPAKWWLPAVFQGLTVPVD